MSAHFGFQTLNLVFKSLLIIFQIEYTVLFDFYFLLFLFVCLFKPFNQVILLRICLLKSLSLELQDLMRRFKLRIHFLNSFRLFSKIIRILVELTSQGVNFPFILLIFLCLLPQLKI